MEAIIRRAQRDELEQVNELRQLVYDMHVRGRPNVFRPGFGSELRHYAYTKFDAEDSDVLVATSDGNICGYAIVEYNIIPETVYSFAQRIYRIAEIGVSENYRRRGVATALLSYMKKDAAARELDKIELDMLEFNDGALTFYENSGFKTYHRYMELPVSSAGEKK